jgi:nucleotide-binding universal stress UspA family protein
MRILHPTDFSQTAGKALAIARDLRDITGGSLHVMHTQARFEEGLAGSRVRPHIDSINPQLDVRKDELRTEEARRLREMLQHVASPDATSELRWGDPYKELLDMQGDYDLVVMGAHGNNRFDNYFLGGVAGRFVRRAKVPVITVREETVVTGVKRVLVATDFESSAPAAVAFAKKLRAFGTKLVLCHIVDDPRLAAERGYINTVTDSLNLLDDGEFERHVVKEGSPVELLPEVARDVGANLIAIGFRHHRATTGLLFGSRADALIRSSPVPILSVPAVTD